MAQANGQLVASGTPITLGVDATGSITAHVSESWLRLICYCAMYLPYGEIKVKIIAGKPTEMLDQRRGIRFDRPETLPKDLLSIAEGL